ncbi:MAG: hypothetical protein GX970_13465 [Phyllobacteriaceae bacterium]|nr:hypothetical protein [Phyllobacteriaceae bacterium]
MKLVAPLVLAAALITVPQASANTNELELNTILLAWSHENCPGFDYPEDLLRHASIDVLQASDEARASAKAKMDFALEGFDNNVAELCDFMPELLVEGDEE